MKPTSLRLTMLIGCLLAPGDLPAQDASGWQSAVSSPILTILGWLFAAFLLGLGAGWGVKKFFEERELPRLRDKVEELAGKLGEHKQREESDAALRDELADVLDAANIGGQLSKFLKHWPEERRPPLISSVVRQLMMTPGTAWLLTPQATVFVRVQVNLKEESYKLVTNAHYQGSPDDPTTEVRELLKGAEFRDDALFDLATRGVVKITRAVGQDIRQTYVVRQEYPGSFTHRKETFKRLRSQERRK